MNLIGGTYSRYGKGLIFCYHFLFHVSCPLCTMVALSAYLLLFVAIFDAAQLTNGNLYHIPGVTKTAPANEGKDDVNSELYLVCSVAEDDTRDDVMEHVERGADLNWVSPEDGITCLFSAIMRGKLQVVETMLEQGADVTIPRLRDGLSPVHAAAYYGRTNELQALQKYGHLVDVNQRHLGIPLIHQACQGFSSHHQRMVSFLVDQGADINQPDWLGRTCLDKAKRKKLIFHIEDLGGKSSRDIV